MAVKHLAPGLWAQHGHDFHCDRPLQTPQSLLPLPQLPLLVMRPPRLSFLLLQLTPLTLLTLQCPVAVQPLLGDRSQLFTSCSDRTRVLFEQTQMVLGFPAFLAHWGLCGKQSRQGKSKFNSNEDIQVHCFHLFLTGTSFLEAKSMASCHIHYNFAILTKLS